MFKKAGNPRFINGFRRFFVLSLFGDTLGRPGWKRVNQRVTKSSPGFFYPFSLGDQHGTGREATYCTGSPTGQAQPKRCGQNLVGRGRAAPRHQRTAESRCDRRRLRLHRDVLQPQAQAFQLGHASPQDHLANWIRREHKRNWRNNAIGLEDQKPREAQPCFAPFFTSR